MAKIKIDEWHGFYKRGWGDILSPSSYEHPAKISFSLAERIYKHVLDEGWIVPGQTVLDPFAGIGGCAFHAMLNGLGFVGIELELKFCGLAAANIIRWNARYAGKLPRWSSRAVVIQGDSCYLLNILRQGSAGAAISSPPYADRVANDNQRTAGRVGDWREMGLRQMNEGDGNTYGHTLGNLGNMPASDADLQAQLAVSSPAYGETVTYQQPGADGEGNELMRAGFSVQEIAEMRQNGDPRILQTKREAGYSRDPDNLGNMPMDAGDLQAQLAVSSPPYIQSNITSHSNFEHDGRGQPASLLRGGQDDGYGVTPGQLGALPTGDLDLALGSPPYADGCAHTGGDTSAEQVEGGRLYLVGATQEGDLIVSSPPYANALTNGEGPGARYDFVSHSPGNAVKQTSDANYGAANGQLGAMPAGDIEAVLTISSPPYEVDALGHAGPPSEIDIAKKLYSRVASGSYGAEAGQLGEMPAGDIEAVIAISSPPYTGDGAGHDAGCIRLDAAEDEHRSTEGTARRPAYGNADGQLGAMSEGEFYSAISSPPFMQQEGAHSANKFADPEASAQARAEGYRSGELAGHYASPEAILRSMEKANAQTYGDSQGQLAAMSPGDLDAAVSSPTYEHRSYEGMSDSFAEWREMQGRDNTKPGAMGVVEGYGHTEGQLAGADTFWSAARQIVEQTFAALRPGAHACWVVKSFVRDKAIVNFPDQWRRLCESVGFVTLHEHHAMLVERHNHTQTLEGEPVISLKEKKSFFRRLSESKARAAKYWEQVGNDDRAHYISKAHREVWAAYRKRRANSPVDKNVGKRPLPVPNRVKIVARAQMLAFKSAGSPDIEIDTAIDFEVVLCQVKLPLETGAGI